MGWTVREKDGLQEKRMDYKRKGWTERGKDGQQKDISVKESPKGPPDLSRVAQPTAARVEASSTNSHLQSQLKPLVRAARQCEGNSCPGGEGKHHGY
jgi:hypothetical protein